MTNKYLHTGKYIVLAVIILWAAGFGYFSLYVSGNTPKQEDNKVDAIIVLTGGANRINTGFDLLNAGQAEQIFISGVDSRVSVEELLRIWKPDLTTPPCCIYLGRMAQNTEENALETRQWLQGRDVNSIKLVTASYHIPRALLEFRKALPDTDIHLYPVTTDNTNKYGRDFWRMTFTEYNKTLLTWVKLEFIS